jgi:outer membrane protein OmpA-like peptidoglycan-associated protein
VLFRSTRGYGASKPIAPNSDEAGRARNRRIEFVRVD